MYKTFWRPATAGTYADRQSDKQVLERSENGTDNGSGCNGKGSGGRGGSGGGYRPPGARRAGGGGGSRSLSDMLGETTSSTGAIKKGSRVNKSGAQGPVGMSTSRKEEGGKNAAKNKARKERQRRAKEATEMKVKQDEADAELKKLQDAKLKADKLENPSLMSDQELAKRIKKLKKQLRAIDALKLKPKDGLNEAQSNKMAPESTLRNALSELESLVASR